MFWLNKGEGFSEYAPRRASRKRQMHRVPMIGTARSVPSPAGRWERAAGAGAKCRLFFLSLDCPTSLAPGTHAGSDRPLDGLYDCGP